MAEKPLRDERELIFGGVRIAASRYKGYQVGQRSIGMVVYLRNPDEKFLIDGAENVVAAHQEIQHVLSPSDAGWIDLE